MRTGAPPSSRAVSRKLPVTPFALKSVTPNRYNGSERKPISTSSPCGFDTTALKLAVTDVFAEIETVQVLVPEHPPPLQPANVAPEPAEAESVTEVPWVKDALQVEPQLMPVGVLVTVPVPVPLFVSGTRKEPGGGGGGGARGRVNVAVTVLEL